MKAGQKANYKRQNMDGRKDQGLDKALEFAMKEDEEALTCKLQKSQT